jgi:hypothetical protein
MTHVRFCFLLLNGDGHTDVLYLTRRASAMTRLHSVDCRWRKWMSGKRRMIATRKSYITRRKIPRPTFTTLMILMVSICVWRVVEAMNMHSSSILHEATEQLFCSWYYLNIFFWRVCNWYHLLKRLFCMLCCSCTAVSCYSTQSAYVHVC